MYQLNAFIKRALLGLFFGFTFSFSPSMECTIFNVGQGHCAYVSAGETAIICDAGCSAVKPPGAYKHVTESIADKLDEESIETLIIVLTHADKDHYNLLSEVLSQLDFDDAHRELTNAYVFLGGLRSLYSSKCCDGSPYTQSYLKAIEEGLQKLQVGCNENRGECEVTYSADGSPAPLVRGDFTIEFLAALRDVRKINTCSL